MTFDEAFDRLIGHEGGYANHPNDPGGETMWGITARVARAAGYLEPMRDLPRGLAKEIYRRQYWTPVRAEELPAAVRFSVFDAAVNSGVGQAVKWLQEAAGVTADGVIGPVTLAAANKDEWRVFARFNGARLHFMAGLPTWPSFGRGWARRVADNLTEA